MSNNDFTSIKNNEEKIYYNNIVLESIKRKDIELIRTWRNNENNNNSSYKILAVDDDLNSRRKNIGFIATKALCEYGFNNLGLNKIILEVYKENIKAFNLYKRVGFKFVKEINNEIILMDIYKDK